MPPYNENAAAFRHCLFNTIITRRDFHRVNRFIHESFMAGYGRVNRSCHKEDMTCMQNHRIVIGKYMLLAFDVLPRLYIIYFNFDK